MCTNGIAETQSHVAVSMTTPHAAPHQVGIGPARTHAAIRRKDPGSAVSFEYQLARCAAR